MPTNPNTSEIFDILSRVSLFANLDKYELRTIAQRAEVQRFQRHQLIFREGDIGLSMYLIVNGEVEVFTNSPDSGEIRLAVLQRGNYFGEQSLLPNSLGKRNASIRVLQDTLLLNIAGTDFQTLLQHDPQLIKTLRKTGEAQTRHKMLQEFVLFHNLPLESTIEGWLEEQQFEAGQVILREGDIGDKFYLVIEGVARAIRQVGTQDKLLGRIGKGSFFGELALIKQAPRAATIVAETPLRVVTLRGDLFLSLYGRFPQLREQMEYLSGFYHQPQKGVITLHGGQFMGLDSFTAVYHAPTGIQVTATKVVGKAIFNMHRIGITHGETTRLVFEKETLDGNLYRELHLQDQRIIGVLSMGEWLDLGRVHDLVMQGKAIYFWQSALFREKGELWLEREARNYSEDTIICRCMGLNRRELNRCVTEGCDSIESLAIKTGASRVCGACAPLLSEIVGRTDMQVWQLLEVIQNTPTVKTLRFKPRDEAITPAKVGQVIQLEAQIRGRWLQRSYMLTAPTHCDYYEIIVQRNAYGVFSSWLHDELTYQSFVRISKPEGNPAVGDEIPVLFFVGGIGIAPALAILRSRAQQANPAFCYVDYSARKPEEFIYQEELRRYNDISPNLQIKLRSTLSQGRITAYEVDRLVCAHPHAQVSVCGSPHYVESITSYLEGVNLPTGQVHVEEFTSHTGWVDKSSIALRRGLWVSSVLTLSVLGLYLLLSVLATSSLHQWLRPLLELDPDNTAQHATGYAVLGLIFGSLTISLRKYYPKFFKGNYDHWRLGHSVLGVPILILLGIHSELHWGGLLTSLLITCLLAIMGVGAVNALVSVWLDHDNSSRWQRVRYSLHLLHLGFFLPLPALLIMHIIAAFYY
jgi:CRP-like cAMP-binding protein/ferredoxin-NADP reductase